MSPGFAAADRRRFALSVWERVFRFRLMPPRPVLHQLILERDALGTTLWDQVMRPALADEVPALFAAAPAPAMRRVAMDLRRVGASAYAVSAALYYLHGDRPEAARTVGVTAMWFAQAAAVMDYLLDEERLSPDHLDAHLGAEVFAAALPPPGQPDAVAHRFVAHHPELRFVMLALDHAFAGLRACFAGARDDDHHGHLHREVLACLQRMTRAELLSPHLRLDQAGRLDEVEQRLDQVNTLVCRLSALAGLALEPAPATARQRAVERAARLVGDIGWTLDALSDICVDLEHRAWNRAWLLLARERARDAAAWRALVADPAGALAALEQAQVVDRLLAHIDAAVAELIACPDLAPAASAQLADIVRLAVWSFLAPRGPA